MHLQRVLACLALLLFSSLTYALNGWKHSFQGDVQLFEPTDLPPGKIFEYRLFGPYELNGKGLESWFRDQAMTIQKTLGQPLQPWVVKPDKQNWSIANSFKHGEVTLSVGYEGGLLEGGKAYIMRMVSTREMAMMRKYALEYYKVLDEAKQIAKTAIRVAPGQGAKLNDIELVWVFSDIDVIWGGIDVDTYLLFKDGTLYMNCTIPPDELNVSASKSQQPKKWTRWRKDGETYQILNKSKQVWVNLRGEPAVVMNTGKRLSGKYLNAGGSQYSGSWKKHIVFHDDGRFDMGSFAMNNNSMMGGGQIGPGGEIAPLVTVMSSSDKQGTTGTSSVIGETVGGGGQTKRRDGSKNTGYYTINPYSITLEHDNGWTHTELFFYEKRRGEYNLVYGNDLYWLDD
ncbi:MAG: hypothetical protein ABW101_03555 [Candidatus Thiodiazotropha sp.]